MLVDAELAGLIFRGAAMLPRTWRAVERCRTDPDPRGDLAVECGAVVQAYVDLVDGVDALARSELGDHLRILLTCQMHVMSAAARLAFSDHGPGWPTLAARFGDARGPLSDELLQLAIDVYRTLRASPAA